MKKNKLSTLSDRLSYALEVTRTKKADLARSINVQPQTIQHLCNGNVKSSRFTFELATALGLNTTWLATGAGEPLLCDDLKKNLFDSHKIVPLLNTSQLISLAVNNTCDDENQLDWVSLQTTEADVFCVVMPDSSMFPNFPKGAKIFFKKINKKDTSKGIVIAYIPTFDSILIRDCERKNNSVFLLPKNKTLFREVEVPMDAVIFGLAIECQFAINIV